MLKTKVVTWETATERLAGVIGEFKEALNYTIKYERDEELKAAYEDIRTGILLDYSDAESGIIVPNEILSALKTDVQMCYDNNFDELHDASANVLEVLNILETKELEFEF